MTVQEKTHGPVLIQADCSAEIARRLIHESLAGAPHRWTIKTDSAALKTEYEIEAYISYREMANTNGTLLALTHKLDLEISISNLSPHKSKVELKYSWLNDGSNWNFSDAVKYCTNNIKLDLLRTRYFSEV